MTEDEIEVLEHLTNAYNAFTKLRIYHPSDLQEFVLHMHAMQNIVMARAAVRAEPERFTMPGYELDDGD